MVKAVKIIANVFGPRVLLKKEVLLDLPSPKLRDVLKALRDGAEESYKQILRDDLSLEKDCVILVNGRNVSSLENLETRIHEGDEITLTVLMAGG